MVFRLPARSVAAALVASLSLVACQPDPPVEHVCLELQGDAVALGASFEVLGYQSFAPDRAGDCGGVPVGSPGDAASTKYLEARCDDDACEVEKLPEQGAAEIHLRALRPGPTVLHVRALTGEGVELTGTIPLRIEAAATIEISGDRTLDDVTWSDAKLEKYTLGRGLVVQRHVRLLSATGEPLAGWPRIEGEGASFVSWKPKQDAEPFRERDLEIRAEKAGAAPIQLRAGEARATIDLRVEEIEQVEDLVARRVDAEGQLGDAETELVHDGELRFVLTASGPDGRTTIAAPHVIALEMRPIGVFDVQTREGSAIVSSKAMAHPTLRDAELHALGRRLMTIRLP